MNPPTLSDRDVRQRALVPPDRLAGCKAVIVGVGAIGRQVALQLAAVGVPELTLIDDDLVGVENLAPQGYWPEDLGAPKVIVTASLCRRVHPPIHTHAFTERFRRSSSRELPCGPAVAAFFCVDRIATRRLLWESLGDRVGLVVDGRMSAEVIRVLAVDGPEAARHYPDTLFEAEEAFAGSCAARSTIYTASVAAGLMVSQMARWLRGLPVERDLTLNLLAAELTVPNLVSQ